MLLVRAERELDCFPLDVDQAELLSSK